MYSSSTIFRYLIHIVANMCLCVKLGNGENQRLVTLGLLQVSGDVVTNANDVSGSEDTHMQPIN